MANRLILVTLLLTTTVAHAQIMGAGGAPADAVASAAQHRTSALPSRRSESPPSSKAKVIRPVVVAKPAPHKTEPQSARPQSVKPQVQARTQAAAKER
jgi:hypothetical protein